MKRLLALTVLSLASTTGFLLSTPVAHADTVSFTLSNPTEYTLPGGTLSFFATVSAPSTNTGLEYLNGDTFSVSGPGALDDTGYFNFPLDLAPGDSFTGLLFTITFPAHAVAGDYPGTFTITGGADANAGTALATVNYDAEVAPEPSTFLLLGTGLAGLVFALRGRWSTFPIRSS